jgi:formylglycine-generating enzyme required for sulfatase activity
LEQQAEAQPAEAGPNDTADELRQRADKETIRKRAERASVQRETKERRQREEDAACSAAEAHRSEAAQAQQQREVAAQPHVEREVYLAPKPIEPLPQAGNMYAPAGNKAVVTQHLSANAATRASGGSRPLPPLPPQDDWQSSFSSFYSSATGFITAQKKPFLLLAGGMIILVVFLIGVAGASLYVWFKSSTSTSSASSTKSAAKAEMAAIPGGTFLMGRSDVTAQDALNQYPAHAVKVDPFYMDKTEVTNAEYAAFVREANYAAPPYWANNQPPAGQEQWPVTNVSLADAQAFAAWRSKRDSVVYRLPTEEEWEFAARDGANAYLYPWGDVWRDGWANVEAEGPQPVGSYAQGASAWGVVDLIGNAWEWTASKNSIYPGNKSAQLEDKERDSIITRGGAYSSKATGAEAITATRRIVTPASTKHPALGFRLVRPGS